MEDERLCGDRYHNQKEIRCPHERALPAMPADAVVGSLCRFTRYWIDAIVHFGHVATRSLNHPSLARQSSPALRTPSVHAANSVSVSTVEGTLGSIRQASASGGTLGYTYSVRTSGGNLITWGSGGLLLAHALNIAAGSRTQGRSVHKWRMSQSLQ